MMKQRFCFTFFLLICFSLPLTVIAQTVNIPDDNLRAIIENAFGRPSGATITAADMELLQTADLRNRNIHDLTGLEYATNMEVLLFGFEQVAPGISVNTNSISDISPLARLTKLQALDLESNSISNISPIEGLTNLQFLALSGNSISNISPLAGLTNLTQLFLGGNSISNISPIEGLTNLQKLYLDYNSISDISPLVANTGLGSGDEVLLQENPLNAASINTHIPALQRRGVAVVFSVNIPDDNLRAAVERTLRKSSGATITTADMARLNRLVALNDNISDLTGLEHATNLTALGLGPEQVQQGVWRNSNSITDISALQGLTKLEVLDLDGNSISNISALERLINLTVLDLDDNNITDISPLSGLTNLEVLGLRENSISNISAVRGLINLTRLELSVNPITDISAVMGLTNLTELYLRSNSISNISAVARLTNLRGLFLSGNTVSNISPLSGLNNLTGLFLSDNAVSNISPLSGLNNLTHLTLSGNSISNISPLSGLNNLTWLDLDNNSISDISVLSGLNNLTWLDLWGNAITDISALSGLVFLTRLYLSNNSISDISPLVANTGLGSGDFVDVSENPLNAASINTHIPALESRGVTVEAEDLKPTTSEYTLTMPAGISLIHVPLKVTAVNRSPRTIESISELYDVLGGAGAVNFLITYDSQTQEWRSYFGPSDKGGPADRVLTDDMGIIAGMTFPRTTHFSGNPLGTDGTSTIILNQGLNLVGLPLNDSRINRVSDLFTLDGIGGNVPVIILTDGGEFKLVGRAGDPGDIAITGGQAFIMTASQDATVAISGNAWANGSGAAAAPPVTLKGIEVGDTTPVLGLKGSIVDEGIGLNSVGFRITVKNLSTGKAVVAITAPDEAGYRSTAVDIETGRAATVGDILELSAQSPNPFIGVEPLRYTVTAEDVKQSLIQLPELVAYEIPAETQLLRNYPNPFNPETWIPYRLAEDAFVTLTIYDGAGQVVRTIDVGHQIAAVYQNRSKAVYWDGRNGLGEQVTSGVYFYHLSAGDYSATRKMVILK